MYKPWGSSIPGVWFSSWYVVSTDTGLIAQSPQSSQDGVLPSRWPLSPPSHSLYLVALLY